MKATHYAITLDFRAPRLPEILGASRIDRYARPPERKLIMLQQFAFDVAIIGAGIAGRVEANCRRAAPFDRCRRTKGRDDWPHRNWSRFRSMRDEAAFRGRHRQEFP